MPSMSLGNSGSVTRLTSSGTLRSWSGVSELNRSLSPAGTTTSLTSGLPSRETCTCLPKGFSTPGCSSIDRRSVSLHTPMTGLCTGSSPSTTSDFGTCNAMVFTLYPARVSCPTSDRLPP